jgi:hypothetical protein
MNLDTLLIQAFLTIILALTSLIVLPVTALMALENPVAALAKDSDGPEGAACDLPPTVEIVGKDAVLPGSEMPSIDKRAVEKFKTATFAMG